MRICLRMERAGAALPGKGVFARQASAVGWSRACAARPLSATIAAPTPEKIKPMKLRMIGRSQSESTPRTAADCGSSGS